MEMHLPEIALKQPKTDPRTVLLHKRNFLESSSDHIQEETQPNKMPFQIRAIYATDKCDDRLQLQQHHTLESRQKSQTATSTAALFSLEASSVAVSSTLSSSHTTTARLASAPSSSSHSTTLVNFYPTCHLYKFPSLHYVNENLNNLYKFQRTKLLLVLVFTCCAISSSYLPTTQAIPVRRTTASGHRLILHSNVYRERYHQNLLQDQRQHQQQQQLVLQKHQQLKHQHQQQAQQRPSSYLAPILRKVHHQLQHHHLHQRAAPTATTATNQQKMSYCESNAVFENLYLQLNTSLPYIKVLCNKFLQDRESKSYEEMKETWKLLKLEIRNPNRKPVTFENELHQKMHDFYLNLHNFHQLVEFVHKYTIENKQTIEHDESLSSQIILTFFETLKNQIKFNMGEAEKVLQSLTIDKPNLDENTVEFKESIAGKIRDFLIIKEFIDELETISELIKMNRTYCESSNNGYSSG